jgi:hypothetical protein
MPGLVPGIHVFSVAKTWMAGTSPAMTRCYLFVVSLYVIGLRVWK